MGASAITEEDAAELLAGMVAIPSVNPAFRRPGDPAYWFNEAALADHVASWLVKSGLAVEIDPVEPERPNVIARLGGSANGPRMLWEGHLDTVQVTGMAEPFTPRIDCGRLYGRGAVDDKGCLAAFMLAMRELARDPPPGDVTFLAAMDEEYGFAGIRHHLARGERFALGIAGEPTDLRIVRACKGCIRWRIEITGKAAHSAKPHEGIDALAIATRLLAVFEAEMALRSTAHPLLGRATLVCTGLEAGEGPNTVPSTAMLRFDYRYLPTEDGSAVWQHFRQLAEAAILAVPGAKVVVHLPFIDSSAMDVPQEAGVVRLMAAVCRQHGRDSEPVGVPYGSDATKMVNLGAIPTVIFGPGSIDQAHSMNEFVELSAVVEAARMLIDAARGVPRALV